jgi:hypothetical protein
MTKTDLTNLALAKIGERPITSLDDPNDKNARHAALHYGQARDEVLRAHFWGFALKAVRLVPEIADASYDRVAEGARWGGSAPSGEAPQTYKPSGTSNGRPKWSLNGTPLAGYQIEWEYNESFTAKRWGFYHAGLRRFESYEDVVAPELVKTWTLVNGSSAPPVFRTLLDEERGGYEAAFGLPEDFLKLEWIEGDHGRIDRFRLQRANLKRCLLADADSLRLHYVSRVDDPAEHDPLFTAAFVTLLASRLARAITGSEQLEQALLQRYEQVDLPAARTADGHDSRSAENHPLEELLDSSLTGRRG